MKKKHLLPEKLVGEVFEGSGKAVVGRLILITAEEHGEDHAKVHATILHAGHDRRSRKVTEMAIESLRQSYRHMPLLTVEEAVRHSGLSKSAIYSWVVAGRMEHLTIYGKIRIPIRALGPSITGGRLEASDAPIILGSSALPRGEWIFTSDRLKSLMAQSASAAAAAAAAAESLKCDPPLASGPLSLGAQQALADLARGPKPAKRSIVTRAVEWLRSLWMEAQHDLR